MPVSSGNILEIFLAVDTSNGVMAAALETGGTEGGGGGHRTFKAKRRRGDEHRL